MLCLSLLTPKAEQLKNLRLIFSPLNLNWHWTYQDGKFWRKLNKKQQETNPGPRSRHSFADHCGPGQGVINRRIASCQLFWRRRSTAIGLKWLPPKKIKNPVDDEWPTGEMRDTSLGLLPGSKMFRCRRRFSKTCRKLVFSVDRRLMWRVTEIPDELKMGCSVIRSNDVMLTLAPETTSTC